MTKNNRFDEQAERFHREIIELVKKYQFRDRNQAIWCGISVSQCYMLETLHRHGPLTMKQLAGKLYLSISTVTRVLDPLVKKGHVLRTEGEKDRRVRLIQLTKKGESLFQKNWKGVFQSERDILMKFPVGQRENLLGFLRDLNQAVDKWRSTCGRKRD